MLLEMGCVETLVELLKSSHNSVLEHAAGALRNAAHGDECISRIVKCNGLTLLLDLVKNNANSEVQKCAAGALKACAKNVKAQYALQQLGGLDLLQLKYPLLK